jgi:4-hydroxyphenylacetate 3-monooxygenase/4-hydroxybutyryl-CoA dehydratase/vinylacetyl-CoA-Delta-isomerase
MQKYIMRDPDISVENQHGAFQPFLDMMSSASGGRKLIDAIHGGWPVIEKVAIHRDHNTGGKNLVKKLTGIPVEGATKDIFRIPCLAVNM